MPPRTIDNLGVDVSTRYAADQKLIDPKSIKDSRGIPAQTEIDVFSPTYPSEIEALTHLSTTQSAWAEFFMPSGFLEQRKRIFTFLIIPSLGSDEKRESQALKILAKLKALSDKTEELPLQKRSWQEQKESEEREKEKKTFITLLDTISSLDKYLIEINARRTQYQKG